MMPLAAVPVDGFTSSRKMQTRMGWWCLEITCTVTDRAKNVFRRTEYVSTGVAATEAKPAYSAALKNTCGNILKAMMEEEVADATRTEEAAALQADIDALTAEKTKITTKAFTEDDGVIGKRA